MPPNAGTNYQGNAVIVGYDDDGNPIYGEASEQAPATAPATEPAGYRPPDEYQTAYAPPATAPPPEAMPVESQTMGMNPVFVPGTPAYGYGFGNGKVPALPGLGGGSPVVPLPVDPRYVPGTAPYAINGPVSPGLGAGLTGAPTNFVPGSSYNPNRQDYHHRPVEGYPTRPDYSTWNDTGTDVSPPSRAPYSNWPSDMPPPASRTELLHLMAQGGAAPQNGPASPQDLSKTRNSEYLWSGRRYGRRRKRLSGLYGSGR